MLHIAHKGAECGKGADSPLQAPEGAVYFEYSQSTGQPSSAVYYDSYGRTLRTVTDAPFGRKVYADIVYNALGQVVKSSEPYFAGTNVLWSTNSYDAVGRTTVQTKPDGSTTSFSYDGLRNTVTDALGHSSYKTRDLNGRLVESVDAMGGYIHYKYDVDGNCIRVEGPRTTIVSEYDLAGHRTLLDDPDMGVSRDTYNAFGELVAHEDVHGTTTYTYDTGGRLIAENRPDMTFTTSYDKDWKGAVSAVSTDGSSKSYSYDGYGRVTEERTDVGKKSFLTLTSYNALGLPETTTYPAGLKVRNDYDSNGFLTPDPFVQALDFIQSLNRYAYCLNNPLSLVDPSGYSWISHNWKSIVSAAVGIAVGAVTLGTGSTVGIAIAAGAASGAASALTGALLNGSNIGQVTKATFCGGFWGAISGCLNYISADNDFIASLFKHAFTQGALEGAQGGNIMHGLYMGAVSALSNKALQAKFMADAGKTLQIVASSVVGGTVEEIGGGKFANGATTAAFSMIFNEIMHRGPTKEQVKSVYDYYEESFEKYKTVASIYAAMGGDIAYYAKTQPQFYQNACAARLSYAFNKAGIKIPRNKWTQQGKGKLNYFLKASHMVRWMKRRWGAPTLVTKAKLLTTGFTTQTGFGHNISGHVGVMYKGNDCTNVIEKYFSRGATTSIWYGR